MSVASSDSDTYIALGANGDVHVAVPTDGENMTVFKGSKKEAKAKECLLFVDKKTGHLLESMKASGPTTFNDSIDMPALDAISQPPPPQPLQQNSYQSRLLNLSSVAFVSICESVISNIEMLYRKTSQ
ncbi:hypothetical protein ANCCEY_09089 [Ancylostoma ceylanicum]|uniref:Ell-associated factor Eaf n=1 Tax=Ancylostoma ceylanicum TaxID=53326 RepID=A0A0D6LII5_9BILA|nr:hypothetical protein ANCCEY_09089 [Ancylostoma ceylanicum]